MRHVGLALAFACAGCNSLLGIEELTLVDADVVPIDATYCYGTLVTRCYETPPTGDVALSGAIDTATDSRCEVLTQPGGPDVCMIAGATIAVDAAGVVATGERPLFLVAAETITVTGSLDVGSRRGMTNGAGANPAVCTTPGAGATARHGGGGAGGSFGSRGGVGGVGGGVGAEAGGGGVPAQAQDADLVRGGCPGGSGGAGMQAQPGSGGAGGGAVYLAAGTSITIDGGIQASGAGAAGTPADSGSSGGGGGGAGGFIGLEAPAISAVGSVVANGGGGGEGGGETASGNPGADGNTFNQAALGGTGGTGEGGDGGRGSVQTMAATLGATGTQGTGQHGGGGGGGGGAGIVWVKGTLTGTSISPPVTRAP